MRTKIKSQSLRESGEMWQGEEGICGEVLVLYIAGDGGVEFWMRFVFFSFVVFFWGGGAWGVLVGWWG